MAAINVSEVYRFVEKPWQDDSLRQVVGQSLERKTLENGSKVLATMQLLQQAVCQWHLPLMALDTQEKVLFYNPALTSLLPSLVCIREGLDLKSFIDVDLLKLMRTQIKNPGLEVFDTVTLDGYCLRPRLYYVEEAGYLVTFDIKNAKKMESPHESDSHG